MGTSQNEDPFWRSAIKRNKMTLFLIGVLVIVDNCRKGRYNGQTIMNITDLYHKSKVMVTIWWSSARLYHYSFLRPWWKL